MPAGIRMGALGAIIAALMIAPLAHAAEYVSARVGGGGGTAYNRDCGSNRVLIGFKANWGSYVDRLRLLCVTWMPATKARGTTILDPPPTLGSTGLLKSETQLSCGSGKLAKGIRGKAATYVDSLSLVCDYWNQ